MVKHIYGLVNSLQYARLSVWELLCGYFSLHTVPLIFTVLQDQMGHTSIPRSLVIVELEGIEHQEHDRRVDSALFTA